MVIRINRSHRLADLSNHQGMLLNRDFGWHDSSLAGGSALTHVTDARCLSERVERLERRVRFVSVSVWALLGGTTVFLLAWL